MDPMTESEQRDFFGDQRPLRPALHAAGQPAAAGALHNHVGDPTTADSILDRVLEGACGRNSATGRVWHPGSGRLRPGPAGHAHAAIAPVARPAAAGA